MSSFFRANVAEVRPFSSSAVQLDLEVSGFTFEAGQYGELGFFSEEIKRQLAAGTLTFSEAETLATFFPYSIASAPQEKYVSFCIRAREDDDVTPFLKLLKTGELLVLKGPGGGFRFQSKKGRQIYLLATGTGISPLRSMFRSAPFQEDFVSSTSLFLGARNEEEILYREEWTSLLQERFVPVLSRPEALWKGERGYLLEASQRMMKSDLSGIDFYLCGYPEFVQQMKLFLAEKGVSAESIFSEGW